MEMGLLLRRPERQVSMKQEVKKLKAANVQMLLIGLTPNILFFALLCLMPICILNHANSMALWMAVWFCHWQT